MISIQRVLVKMLSQVRSALMASFFLAVFSFTVPAHASLIGTSSTIPLPDISVSYLDVLNGTSGLIGVSSQSTFMALQTSSDYLDLSGSYLLLYDPILGTGSFSLAGALYDDPSQTFSMSGHVVRAGDNGDGRSYDFQVKLDAIGDLLAGIGFGGVGSTIYTDLLYNGQTWQSDIKAVAEPVPEPSTILLMSAGLLGAVYLRRRRP